MAVHDHSSSDRARVCVVPQGLETKSNGQSGRAVSKIDVESLELINPHLLISFSRVKIRLITRPVMPTISTNEF
jgi:hypothetical protein